MLPSSWPCPPLPPRASGPHLASIRKTTAGGQGWCKLRGQLRGEVFWECLLLRPSFPTRGGALLRGVRGGCTRGCHYSLEAGRGALGSPPSAVFFGPCVT